MDNLLNLILEYLRIKPLTQRKRSMIIYQINKYPITVDDCLKICTNGNCTNCYYNKDEQVSGVPPQADQVSPLTLRFRRDFRCASTGYQVPGFRGEPVETKNYIDVEDLEVYKCIGVGSS